MNRTYYLAARAEDKRVVRRVVEDLQQLGWSLTYDWTQGTSPSSPETMVEKAVCRHAGVEAADLVLVLLPGDRSTHVELGLALALGKPTFVWAWDRQLLTGPNTCPFYHLAATGPGESAAVAFCHAVRMFEQITAVDAEAADDPLTHKEHR